MSLQHEAFENLPFLKRPLLAFVTLAAVLSVVPALAPAAYVGAAVYALRGPRQTIEALTILILLLLGNGAIFGGGGGNLRWLVLFAGFGRVVWDTVLPSGNRGALPGKVVLAIAVFFASTLVAAVVNSQMPGLSVLKLVSFTVGVVTIFVSFHRTWQLHHYWHAWFMTFFAFALGGSIVVYAAGMGYERTTRLFQGMFIHPQILGPVAGIAAAWITGQLLFIRRNAVHLVLVGIALLCLFFSGARTGAFALAVGMLLAVAVWWLWRGQALPLKYVRTSGTMLVFLFVLAPVLVIKGPTLVEEVNNFILKDDFQDVAAEGPGTGEVFTASRGDRMEASMDNFKAQPLLGIGFGVPTNYASYSRIQTGMLGIPVSASSEKGFMPSAVLEEVGVVGAILVVLMFLAFAVPVMRYGSFAVIWLFWAGLSINVGAAVYFSIGGIGLFMWLVLGFCFNQAVGAKMSRYPPTNRRSRTRPRGTSPKVGSGGGTRF